MRITWPRRAETRSLQSKLSRYMQRNYASLLCVLYLACGNHGAAQPFVPSNGIRPPMHAGQAPVLRGAASAGNGLGRVRGVAGMLRHAKASP